jgi:hypothetical protein
LLSSSFNHLLLSNSFIPSHLISCHFISFLCLLLHFISMIFSSFPFISISFHFIPFLTLLYFTLFALPCFAFLSPCNESASLQNEPFTIKNLHFISLQLISDSCFINMFILSKFDRFLNFVEWPREKWEIGNFTQFKIFSAVWRRSGMTSVSKTSPLCFLSGRSA